MRLVIDASVLVGDLLRAAGRLRIGDARLELFVPEQMREEAQVEVRRRVAAFAGQRGLDASAAEALASSVLEAVDANIGVVDRAVYAAYEDEARSRSVRDRFDWPLVACALALDAGVWTHDADLFGTGVATWGSVSLQAWLDRHPAG